MNHAPKLSNQGKPFLQPEDGEMSIYLPFMSDPDPTFEEDLTDWKQIKKEGRQ